MIFEDLKSKTVLIRHREKQMGVQIDFSDFSTLAIWTKKMPEAEFICIEPWHGMAHIAGAGYSLKDKKGIQSLEIGQRRIYTFTTEIL